jgi:hypothetical protein
MRRHGVEVRVHIAVRSGLFRFAPMLLISCSSTPSGAIELITGEESDTFSRQPAPTSLQVDGGFVGEQAHACDGVIAGVQYRPWFAFRE